MFNDYKIILGIFLFIVVISITYFNLNFNFNMIEGNTTLEKTSNKAFKPPHMNIPKPPTPTPVPAPISKTESVPETIPEPIPAPISKTESSSIPEPICPKYTLLQSPVYLKSN